MTPCFRRTTGERIRSRALWTSAALLGIELADRAMQLTEGISRRSSEKVGDRLSLFHCDNIG